MLSPQTLILLTRYRRFKRDFVKRIVHSSAQTPSTTYRIKFNKNADRTLIGTILANKYFVLSWLGMGGMSIVYKAKRLHKQRLVAVKTLRAESLYDERTIQRFKREADLLSRLNHPRIVQVSDYGITKTGQPYFIMDYLTGESLSDVLKWQGTISPERVRSIFSQVCGAVDHAHRCGVIHRDLKPGNIMLSVQDGEKDYVKVVDFGIGRFQEEAQKLTRIGEVWGSPVYMSPEQCQNAPIDHTCDIYSLGVAMYEVLTGYLPFLGKDYVETMVMQISQPAKPFQAVNPNISCPPALEAVVMKALEKDPKKRYQSMSALREALEKAVPRQTQLRPDQVVPAGAKKPRKMSIRLSSPNQTESMNAGLLILLILLFVLLSLICISQGRLIAPLKNYMGLPKAPANAPILYEPLATPPKTTDQSLRR